MQLPIQIIIIDDHQIVIDGIEAMLELEEQIEIAGKFTDAQKALDYLDNFQPHIVLTDVEMPNKNGADVLEYCKSKFPKIKVLALSMHADQQLIKELINKDLDGYLMKITGKNEFVKAIKNIATGHKYFSSDVVQILAGENQVKTKHPNLQKLTNREIEILSQIAEGFTNKEVANKLNISQRTVESHRSNLMKKLEIQSTVELIKIAISSGLT